MANQAKRERVEVSMHAYQMNDAIQNYAKEDISLLATNKIKTYIILSI